MPEYIEEKKGRFGRVLVGSGDVYQCVLLTINTQLTGDNFEQSKRDSDHSTFYFKGA